jgi:hypothetical protein
MRVAVISRREAIALVVAHHYMHRKPPVSFCFGLIDDFGNTKGCITFGTPASHHMLIGACKAAPENVIELNRLWCHDDMPRNTESWFVSRALALLPPKIVLSYADTAAGHMGYIYRAANFYYAGWTDMERKTPRFDYIAPGKHSRDAFRNGFTDRVRRKPKVKYWTVTGNRRERKRLEASCLWPKLNWKTNPPPTEHRQAA